ncbi:MAG: UbiH/UbiF family hydroxylase [Rhizobiaceae bacterium]
MSAVQSADIIIAGNGPAGMAAAIALAKAGFDVAIAAPAQTRVDQRTTALMMPSIRFLDSLGVFEELTPAAAPLRAMRIVDGTSRLVRSRPVTFRASEISEDAFGYNMPNMALTAALDSALGKEARVRRFDQAVAAWDSQEAGITAVLADGNRIHARLAIGADGRNSLAREHAGIQTRSWTYPQTAFVTTFAHRLPHEGMSTEFHTETGPCTQVPLPGNRSSLVWVVLPERAAELAAMPDAQLSAAIENRLQSFLGAVTAGPERQTYPLSGQYPLRFGQNRVALVGEAAHVFPPIGAQGLNLGFRDVQDLVKAASSNPVDPGAPSVLDTYDRARRPDIIARTGAVDALNRTLLTSFLPAQMLRAAGLAALDAAPPLRGLFMREGMRPGSGFAGIFSSLREKISRNKAVADEIDQH